MGVWPDSDDYAYAHSVDDTWIWIGQMVSHDVGHTLDLFDHGQTDGTGYYIGHGDGWTMWGAIMGWDSWSLGVWDDADYPNPNHSDDSIAIIDSETGVDFRPDDHGSDIGTATAIVLPETLSLVAEGIIEQRTDVDYFAFTTSGGNVQFSINEDVVMGSTNLDVLAKIHDSSGAVLYEYALGEYDVTGSRCYLSPMLITLLNENKEGFVQELHEETIFEQLVMASKAV